MNAKPLVPILTRRDFVSGSARTAAALSLLPFNDGHAKTMAAQHVVSLGALAAEKGLLFGGSFSVAELDATGGAKYGDLYKQQAQVLTSELEFKIASLRPTPDSVNFGPAERLIAFAKANGQKVRGHTLIWNDYLPDWIKALGPLETERFLEQHLILVMSRYRGQVFEWYVVNEPIGPWDKLPGNLRGGLFYAALGESYIERSFRLAKQLDPSARLFLNEEQTETDDENGRVFRQSFLALLRRLADKGVPITGVGLQCHLTSKAPYNFEKFAAFIHEIAALGFEISITELDVNDAAFPDSVTDRDKRVAQLYAQFLSSVLPIQAVKLLTTWQMMDEKSWLWYSDVEKKPTARRRPRPLLFDGRYKPKPAYYAVADALRASPAR